MPTSHPSQINEMVALIMMTGPKSMLDVGVGFGKFGFLAREYLELWDGEERYGEWKVRIDGIEIFESYLTPVHDYIYDDIYRGNASDVLPGMRERQYDLIVMADVLEHFSREDGLALLEQCERVSRNTLVSVPRDVSEQAAAFGNEYERHLSSWSEADFQRGRPSFVLPHPASLITYMGDDAIRVAKALQG